MPNISRKVRLNTKILEESVLHVNMEQDFDIIEILSLKINKNDIEYYTDKSNYGCVVGRVLANNGFGIPNAKISVFIKQNTETQDDTIQKQLYPYSSTINKNEDGIRYNLLPEEQLTDCHTPVGTFPDKRMVLDDDNMNDIYEKYYTFTTRTNDSGDYILFGVPSGTQTIHCDIDLSDCGMLSQKPRDLMSKGYNKTEFESTSKFKGGTDLDSLGQIFSQDIQVAVNSFWGDTNKYSDISITRCDINISYKFEPSCMFIGSIFTDNGDNGFNQNCIPTSEMGLMSKLQTGTGTIEMIRKTPDDTVEEYQIEATQLIDGNGTWCYQIPMNLDYMMTDEYGNLVPTDDPTKGIPTRTRVRFRISLTDNGEDIGNNHFVKILVPHNPKEKEDIDYIFGTTTLDDEYGTKSFRDLFWNKIYTVKCYIPRIQLGYEDNEDRFSGIKSINLDDIHNPIPYNNLRINRTQNFVNDCATFNQEIAVATQMNALVNFLCEHPFFGFILKNYKTPTVVRGDYCSDLKGWYFAPGLKNEYLQDAYEKVKEAYDKNDGYLVDKESVDYQNKNEKEDYCVTNNITNLIKCYEVNIAEKHNVIQFDFYNDWLNGCLYLPRWFSNIKSKKTYFFGKVHVEKNVEGCFEDGYGGDYMRFVQQCSPEYSYNDTDGVYNNFEIEKYGCVTEKELIQKMRKMSFWGFIYAIISGYIKNTQRCHESYGRKWHKIFSNNNGGVHTHKTYLKQNVYYFKPCEFDEYSKRCILFATDIVLLGSFNENDDDGITNMVEKFENTTYHMPTYLAETNMEHKGFMFGTDNGISICNGHKEDVGVIKINDTFEAYKKWSSRQDFSSKIAFDRADYPITISSGINWSYYGPNQAYKDSNGNEYVNKLYYYPGGHFTSVSCYNSMTNVSSCINLSRICEIGVQKSTRKFYVYQKSGETPDYGVTYIMPNGLITGFNIYNADIRTSFSTFNYNGLKTKRNPETYRLKYDFKQLIQNNFGGELKTIFDATGEILNGYSRPDNLLNGDKLLSMDYDEYNPDYYYYRLGIDASNSKEKIKREIIKKHLYKDGNMVSMPVYENSFYFYFGLNKGNTALDRLINDYYSVCPSKDEYNPRFLLEEDEPIEICDGSGKTTNINVTIYDINPPYILYLYKDKFPVPIKLNISGSSEQYIEIDEENDNYSVEFSLSNIQIKGVGIGKYAIVIGNSRQSSIENEIEIKEKVPVNISDFTSNIIIYDFENYLESIVDSSGNTNYIDFSYFYIDDLKNVDNSKCFVYDFKENIWNYIDYKEKLEHFYYRYLPTKNGDIGGYISLLYGEYVYLIICENECTSNSDSSLKIIEDYKKEFNINYDITNIDCTWIEKEDPKEFICMAWRGNRKYKIYLVIDCKNLGQYKFVNLGEYLVTMNYSDIYIGNENVSVKEAKTQIIKNTTLGKTYDEKEWWSKDLCGYYHTYSIDYKSMQYLSDSELRSYIFKRSTFYDKSFYVPENYGSVKYGVIMKDDDFSVEGYGEEIIDGGNKLKGDGFKEYDEEKLKFPSDVKIRVTNVVTTSGSKTYDNMIEFEDVLSGYTYDCSGYTNVISGLTQNGSSYRFIVNNAKLKAYLPLIYRPFYMHNYLIIEGKSKDGDKEFGYTKNISLKNIVANGITGIFKNSLGVNSSRLGNAIYRVGDKDNPYLVTGETGREYMGEKIYPNTLTFSHGGVIDKDYVGRIIRHSHDYSYSYRDYNAKEYVDYESYINKKSKYLEIFFPYTYNNFKISADKFKNETFQFSISVNDYSHKEITEFKHSEITTTTDDVKFIEGFNKECKNVKYYKCMLKNINPFEFINKDGEKVFLEYTHLYPYEDFDTEVNQYKYCFKGTKVYLPKYMTGVKIMIKKVESDDGTTYDNLFQDVTNEILNLGEQTFHKYYKENYMNFYVGVYEPEFEYVKNEFSDDKHKIKEGGNGNKTRHKVFPKHTSTAAIMRHYSMEQGNEFFKMLYGNKERFFNLKIEFSISYSKDEPGTEWYDFNYFQLENVANNMMEKDRYAFFRIYIENQLNKEKKYILINKDSISSGVYPIEFGKSTLNLNNNVGFKLTYSGECLNEEYKKETFLTYFNNYPVYINYGGKIELNIKIVFTCLNITGFTINEIKLI